MKLPSIPAVILWLALAVAPVLAIGQEVMLPENPGAVCNAATMYEATSKTLDCGLTMFFRSPAVESCCKVMAEYFGHNSALPSRNCFCVESYWSGLLKGAAINRIKWKQYMGQCTEMGYEIYYFQDGEGPCAGPAPPAAAEKEVEEEVEEQPVLPMRTFPTWMRELSDGWAVASVIFALLSVFGGSAMAWTFVHDAFTDMRSCFSTRKA